MKLASTLGVVGAAVLGFAAARWLNPGPTDIRSPPAGQVDMSAAAPRLNGRPDLSGLWEAERTPTAEFVRVLGPGLAEIQPDLNEVTKHTINVFWDLKPEDVPLRPEAAAITEARQKSGKDFQSAYCLPSGVPASTLTTHVKMVQGPREIAVLSGGGDPPRESTMTLLPDDRMYEFVCTENQKFRDHLAN